MVVVGTVMKVTSGLTASRASRTAIKALKLNNSKLDGIRKAEAELRRCGQRCRRPKDLVCQRKIAAKAKSTNYVARPEG